MVYVLINSESPDNQLVTNRRYIYIIRTSILRVRTRIPLHTCFHMRSRLLHTQVCSPWCRYILGLVQLYLEEWYWQLVK